MAYSLFTLSVSFILASAHIGLYSAAHLDIDPSTFDPLTSSTVKISCNPDNKDAADKVSLIELFRGRNKLIASVSHNTTTHVPASTAGKYQVDGHVDVDGGQSFLRVILLNPTVDDSGVYTCVMYIGQTVHRDEANGSLVVYSVSKEINALRDRVAALEKFLDESENEELGIDTRVSFMESKMDEHRKVIDDFRDKVQFESAFSATLKKPAPYVVSSTLVFDKVTEMIGADYNPKTGIYTAPRDGLYFFYLTIGTTKPGVGNYVNIMVNKSRSIASTGTGSETFIDENSVSTSVELKAKDTVRVVMTQHGNGPFRDQGITIFGGYCIKAYH